MSWLDVTLPLDIHTPPYPGDPGLRVDQLMAYERGDACQLSAITLSAHLGTHLDAPLHFMRNGASIDQIPIATFIGEAYVVELLNRNAITAQELEPLLPQHCARVLIKTSNSKKLYPRPSAWLAANAAELLCQHNLSVVGIDSLSIDALTSSTLEAHHILLEHGCLIIENLMLTEIAAGCYDMICLPLNLAGLEGAPARVVLRKKKCV